MVSSAIQVGARRFTYAPLLVLASGLLFAKNLAYAKFLSVEAFGWFNQAALLASAFVGIAGAGLPLLGHKMLPQYYSRGQGDLADDLICAAMGSVLVAASLAATVLLVAWAFGLLSVPAWWFGLLLYSVAQFLFALQLIDIKSHLRFTRHAMLSIARAAALSFAGVFVAAASRNVTLVLVVEGCITLLAAWTIVSPARLRTAWKRWQAIPQGWPWLERNLPTALRLLWLNAVLTVLYTLDRWAGLSLLGAHEFGLYSLGLAVIVVFEMAQSILNVAVYPLMARMVSRDAWRDAFRLALKATVVVLLTASALYFPATLLLEELVNRYLPDYREALTVVKLAVVAGSLRLADFFCSFAILCDRERRLSALFVLEIMVAIAALTMLRYAFGVRFTPESIAWAAVVISATALATNIAVASRAYRASLRAVAQPLPA